MQQARVSKQAMATELLCRHRLHNQLPLRVISGNWRLFHHGESVCISWISSVVGIAPAGVSHRPLYPRGNTQTIQPLRYTVIHCQLYVHSKLKVNQHEGNLVYKNYIQPQDLKETPHVTDVLAKYIWLHGVPAEMKTEMRQWWQQSFWNVPVVKV